jgi:hypothetical protein
MKIYSKIIASAVILVLSACASRPGAKELEFEFMILDAANPFSKNIESEKKEFLKNLKFEGVKYDGTKNVTTFELFREFAKFDPHFETKEKRIYSTKKASNIIIEKDEIRFTLPSDYLYSIHVTDGTGREIDMKTPCSYVFGMPQKNIDLGKDSYVKFETNFLVSFSVFDENHTSSHEHAANLPSPHDNVQINVESDNQFLSAITNPLSSFKGEESKGLYLTYNNLEITSMMHTTQPHAENAKIAKYPSHIKEYRYAMNGKIFKIEGWVYHEIITHSREEKLYKVYFYPDASKYLHFAEARSGWDVINNIKNNDISHVLAYEKKILKDDNGDEAIPFKKSMEYVRHVLSASQDELQKEFDAYKKIAPHVKIKD